MIRRLPKSTPTATLFPYTARFRSYAPLGELSRHARVLRYGDHAHRRRVPALRAAPAGWALDAIDRLRLRARGNRLQGQWQVRADESLAALWSSPGAGDGPVAARDLDFLRWRFDQSPLAGTRYLVVREDRKSTRLNSSH